MNINYLNDSKVTHVLGFKNQNASKKTSYKKKNKNINKKKSVELTGFHFNAIRIAVLFSIAIISTILTYTLLLRFGAKKSMNILTDTIAIYSDSCFEEYIDYAKNISNGKEELENVVIRNLDNNLDISLREMISTMKDFDYMYAFNNNKLYQIGIYSIRQIYEDAPLYKYFKTIKDTEDLIVSDWTINTLDGNMIKIVPFRYPKHPEYIFGIGYKPSTVSYSLGPVLKALDDINIEFTSSNGTKLYNKERAKIKNLLIDDKKEDNDKSIIVPQTRLDENGNKLSMIEVMEKDIYKLMNKISLVGLSLIEVYSYAEKSDMNIRVEVSELIKQYNHNIVFAAIMVFALFITFIYVFASNIDKKKINLDILYYSSVALIIFITFDVVYVYTTGFEKIRCKELMGDGYLLYANSESECDVDKIEDFIINELQGYQINDSNYDDCEQKIKQIIKETYERVEKNDFISDAAYVSSTCKKGEEHYNILYNEMKNCNGINSYIDEDNELLHIIKYDEKIISDNKLIFKNELVFNKRLFKLEKSNNYRKPKIYVEIGNNVYLIDDKISESKEEFDFKYDSYDRMKYSKQNTTATIKFTDSYFGFDTYLQYPIDTTILEYILIISNSILSIAICAYLIFLSFKKENFDEVKISKDIYGEISYYNSEELNKQIKIKEELNNIETAENESVSKIYIQRRRKHYEDESDNDIYQVGDENLNVSDKVERNELKELGILKSNKEIFKRFSDSQHVSIEQYGTDGGKKDMYSLFATEDEAIGNGAEEDSSLTLEQANEKYRKNKLSKEDLLKMKADKQAAKQNEDEIDDEQLLRSSKDEDFVKALNDKFKKDRK